MIKLIMEVSGKSDSVLKLALYPVLFFIWSVFSERKEGGKVEGVVTVSTG